MQQPDENSEIVLLESEDVKITNRSVIAEGKTYALSDISSVKTEEKLSPGCWIVPVIFLSAGLIFLFSYPGTLREWWKDSNMLCSAGLVVLGFYALFMSRPMQTVKITTTSGDHAILSSKSEALVRRVVEVIRAALVPSS